MSGFARMIGDGDSCKCAGFGVIETLGDCATAIDTFNRPYGGHLGDTEPECGPEGDCDPSGDDICLDCDAKAGADFQPWPAGCSTMGFDKDMGNFGGRFNNDFSSTAGITQRGDYQPMSVYCRTAGA